MTDEPTVSGLDAPIVELLRSLGSGRGAGAAEVLRDSADAVEQAHARSRDSVDRMYDAWRGRAGDAALDQALRTQTTAATAAERGRAMADMVDRVDAEIEGGRRELQEILRSFRAEVEGLRAGGSSAGGESAVVESAIEHIGRAKRVIERVRAQLASETTAMAELSSPIPAPAVVPPAAIEADAMTAPAAAGTQAGGEIPRATLVAAADRTPPADTGAPDGSGGGPLGSGRTHVGSRDRLLGSGGSSRGGPRTVPASVTTPKASGRGHDSPAGRPRGGGVWVTLPDGSRVEAPNQQAAEAVRSALSAVGTPYVWGGVTPGVGVDCSGLTQWAYGQAGVALPRLAQEQGIGHASVGPGDLMPGDLAVWDGHVALVIGNGQLVEAGDPVQIGPIRTENSGMRFLGFYRPTA
ncbi:C40 family peptidase [Nocardia tengchongensis]|uniref:C40 family peptidase n=1 Tax=Nocardia tengchongensis TaxID=2055889 RepID=UPI00367C47FA